MPPQATPVPDKDTPTVSPGMFGGPQPAMPVAGPGRPETTVAAASARANAAPKRKRTRTAAPKKKPSNRGRGRARSARKPAAAAPAVAATPARRGRVASIKLDMDTMLRVLNSTKKKDQQALFQIVSALNPLSKPQRIRVMQGVANLLNG